MSDSTIRRCAVCGRLNPHAYVAICGKDLTRYYCGWPSECFRDQQVKKVGAGA